VSGRRKRVLLHCELLGRTGVDHINGDTLDNTRKNLRPATKSQNAMNSVKRSAASSKFKGVSWHKQHKKWVTRITLGGRCHHVGLFHLEEDAARAYDCAASKMFGEFARLNFA
jgi:hypothetical protein